MIDYTIIGGGFYGICIALHLRAKDKNAKILIIEQESQLMMRASYTNQARVHNGYHYPRSFTTALRSRVNLPVFLKDFPFAVKTDFTKLYCIAKKNSKVNSVQFLRFCKEIGAFVQPAEKKHKDLFDPRLIEAVYLTQEYAFDTSKIQSWAMEQLSKADINVHYETTVKSIRRKDSVLQVNDDFSTGYIFNSTYSGLNTLGGDFSKTTAGLKHEITEMALIEPPSDLKDIGITVMDGPFFSMMPFPARNLYTLSHVRYTPHFNWLDDGRNPYDVLNDYARESRYDRMIRDVQRFMPVMKNAVYKDSLFEVKTVLVKNESDDGRPILFESYANLPNFYSILGGKLDNIYDILQRIDVIIK